MTQISNPVDRKKIKDALQEMSNAMTRVAAERDLMKEIIDDICAQHNLEKKIFRKMAKVYHKSTFSEEVAEHEQFEELYETITEQIAE